MESTMKSKNYEQNLMVVSQERESIQRKIVEYESRISLMAS